MPISPITHQDWLLLPPLDMPLTLRLENGRFDSLRPNALPGEPPCATTQTAANLPHNPGGVEGYFRNGLHLATDLASVAGNCVYAAYSGRVARVEINLGGTAGSVAIDHHPPGLGFFTNYIHITDIRVSEGDFVHQGQPFAEISAEPASPHLHFELWAVVNGEDPPPGDGKLASLDPTRALYAWEQRLVADEPLAGTPIPLAVGLTRLYSIPFFVARFAGGVTLHVPMYEPMTEDERLTVGVLREAHRRGTGVQASFRHSAFWGLDVVTQAELG
jgi:hypothetical protein